MFKFPYEVPLSLILALCFCTKEALYVLIRSITCYSVDFLLLLKCFQSKWAQRSNLRKFNNVLSLLWRRYFLRKLDPLQIFYYRMENIPSISHKQHPRSLPGYITKLMPQAITFLKNENLFRSRISTHTDDFDLDNYFSFPFSLTVVVSPFTFFPFNCKSFACFDFIYFRLSFISCFIYNLVQFQLFIFRL